MQALHPPPIHTLLQRSLKTRVVLFTLVIFVIGIWVLAFSASRMLREDMERMLGDQQSSTASFVAEQINQELQTRLQILNKVAGIITPAILGKPTALQALLEERLILQGPFNGGVFVTGLDGVSLASIPLVVEGVPRIGVSYMDRDYIITALREGKPAIGKPVMGKLLQSPVFLMAVPILDARREVVGALAGVINLGKPNFLDKITDNGYGKTGGYVLTAPQHRLIVTATNKSRIMAELPAADVNPMMDRYAQGYEGVAVFINSLGVEVIATVKRVPIAGWYLAVSLPTAEAFFPIRDMQQRMLSTTILLTLLAGGLTWWMLRRQLAPIEVAAHALSVRSRTGMAPEPLPNPTQDEIGQLIGGFNTLLASLQHNQERLRLALGAARQSWFDLDIRTGEINVSPEYPQLLGYDPAEFQSSLQNWLDSIHPEDRPAVTTAFQNALATNQSAEMGYRRQTKSGDWIWIHSVGKVVQRDSEGKPLRMTGIHTDITALKNAELERIEAEKRLRAYFERSMVGMATTSPEKGWIDVNPALCEMLGYSAAELLKKTWAELTYPDDLETDVGQFNRLLSGEINEYEQDKRFVRSDGRVVYTHLAVRAVRKSDNNVDYLVALVEDITDRKRAEDELRKMATTDFLTGLASRRHFIVRLEDELARFHRAVEQPIALLMLDLDHFKKVNDSFGHAAGDTLLKHFAAMVEDELRRIDIAGRLGGEEFGIILPGADADAAMAFAGRLCRRVAESTLSTGKERISYTVSIGVTHLRVADTDPDAALARADGALYRAKELGRNRVEIANDA